MSRKLSGLVMLIVLGSCFAEEAEIPGKADPPKPVASSQNPSAPRLVFLGDSLSAGMGVDPAAAFPALIEKKIEAADWDFQVVNAGVSGDTTSGGLSRLEWLLRAPIDVLVLELGGNDGLRGVPLEVIEGNLQKIIDRTRAQNPDVEILVAEMRMPPNLGSLYTEEFRALFDRVADRNRAVLIPFLLQDLVGKPSLIQADGTHPTTAGHQLIADHVWTYLRPVLAP